MAGESGSEAGKALAKVEELSPEQTRTETRNCGPVAHGNEGRFLKLIIMMSPVVAPAASKL